MLISLRNIYTVLIFSPSTRAIKWIQTGRSVEQHSPRFLPDGSLVMFDNTGGDKQLGGARVLRERLGQNGYPWSGRAAASHSALHSPATTPATSM